MARPREFDIDEALEGAMNVFWAKGYEGTSLPDLLDAMKIARGSLYKAFQDKRSIYLAALDRYNRMEIQHTVDALRDPTAGDGAARIRHFLEDARAAVVRRHDRRGCFLCNAAVDQAPADTEIQVKVLAMIKRMERAVGVALHASALAADWPATRKARMALALTNAYLGLRVLARSGAPAKDLAAVIQTTLLNCGLTTDAADDGGDNRD
ncbi:TetR/AcrR family transcriptional regulator [Dongia sp.]|uniref:TetR/AcrR family transcriptional regulator n=1 Tax=Dongia sp. TaxID=1977262 RepID=UPI0035AEB5F7